MIRFNTPYTPDAVDYDAFRFTVLHDHFNRMMNAGEIQCANYCLARDGKVFANTALGKFCYRPEDTRETQPDTIQKIASITKLFCTVAIFKLLEDGRIRLNQPVGDILPEFNTPPFNGITPAHLLSHTSGLPPDPGCFENKYFKSPWYFIENAGDTPWLEAALSCGLRKKTGEEWAYCSFGFAVLGEIVSRVTGRFVHEYITENILKPCGMNDSGFMEDRPKNAADRERKIPFAKRLLVRDEETERGIADFITGKEPSVSVWDSVPSTAGGMYSTAEDLCKFGTMLLNKGTINGNRVLGRKTVERMTEQYTTSDIRDYCWGAGGVPRAYALGPDLRRTPDSLYSKGTFFHEGAGACCLIIDPQEKLVASWFVPFKNDQWYAHGLYNAAAIMWSGLR